MIQPIIDRLRQPEYTGVNRCVPCTVVNLVIALILSRLIAVRSALAGVCSFVAFIGAISLRGYLIPGTPTLTKRYFPAQIHQLIGKHPIAEPPGRADVNPEQILREANVLDSCEETDDVCLSDEFSLALSQNIGSMDGIKPDQDSFGELLGVNNNQLSTSLIEEDETEAYVVTMEEGPIIPWESQTAFLVDFAAARELRTRYSEWENLPPATRNIVCRGIRAFIDTCPLCGGTVCPDEEIVESCCSSIEVIIINCHDCGVKILEVPAET